MKKTFQILAAALLLIIGQKVTAQEYIKNFDGIPILSIAAGGTAQFHYDSMKAMGVNVILAQNIDNNTLQWIYNREMKAIPWQTDSTLMNYIIKYTEGRYTKWEAEGSPEADGMASLSYEDSIGMPDTIAGVAGIITKDSAQAGTLIDGPGYRQEVKYSSIDPNTPIDYKARFRLRLSYSQEETGSPSDAICILQVTNSKIENGAIVQVQIIKDTTLLRSDFTMGAWDTTQLSYDLTSLNFGEETTYNRIGIDPQQVTRTYASYVEFKVIWLGNPNYRLFVDNITVYDERGLRIVTNDAYKELIALQEYSSFNTGLRDSAVAAWYALDEPECIDNYEPIRIVNHILDSVSIGKRGLWVALPSSWNGKFGDSDLGTHKLYKFDEFYRRTKINSFQNNHPLYHYPYANADSCNGCDYKLVNIDALINSALDKLNDYDSIYFSMTLLCGRYDPARLFHDPLPHEMLYEANLKLLYGAKSLSLYRYFGNENDTTFSGLVIPNGNDYYYTPKYYMMKETLSPRLSGLFGKTLRVVEADTQFAGSRGINAVDSPYVNYPAGVVKKIEPKYGADGDERCFIELGFFHKPDEYNKRYFMPLNRYYSNIENLKFTLKNLYTYKNWNLVDYVEGRTAYLVADGNLETVFYDTISKGDARLYSIAPTIIYGGTLTADETLQNTAILQNELIVNPGVTLTINNSLTSYGDIRLKDGSKLRTTNHSIGGTITFLQGKKLIIEGEVEITGLLDKKLTIDFTSRINDNGIKVYDGNKLTIKNTILKNAYKGILVDAGELYIDSSEVIGCNRGLYLNNTNYQIDMHEGTKVWNSTFHENHCGIAFLESSAMVVGNDISNNRDYGVMCLENSSPVFGELLEPGLNRFGNIINLYSSYSFPVVGIDDREYIAGYNIFEGREVDWHIIAIEKSTLMAENNWWDSGEPDLRKFYTDESSTIDIIPFLNRPPFEFICPQANNNLITSNTVQGLESTLPMNDYMRALKYFYTGDKKNCRVLLKNILQNYPDSIIAFASLNLLHRTYNSTTGIDSLKIYLQQFTTTTSQGDIVVYGKLLMAELDKTNYVTKLSNLLNTYSNSSLKDLICFKKFKYYLFNENSPDSARIISNQMLSLFPESPLAQETKFMLGDDVFQKSNTKSGTLPLSYFLGNYPNPFNPVTTIKYSLPQAEKVNITVYDVLGSEVKELVNEEKEAGNYEVTLNASNLSSGYYFYRMVTRDFVKTMKMMAVK